MTKRRGPQPPPGPPQKSPFVIGDPPSLLELDRFSTANLASWKVLAGDLDEVNDQIYFGLEPQRQRLREEMLAALENASSSPFSFERWIRLVTYQYSLTPLSAAGSLTSYGGRFNTGLDVDKAMRPAWPALYIASDQDTAFREKFQISQASTVDGLTAQELALESTVSYSNIFVDGHVEKIFDVSNLSLLEPFAEVLSRIKMPAEVPKILPRLGLSPFAVFLVRSASQLQKVILEQNWRQGPVQFGLPSASQIFAELVRDAGFEGIRYPSTKGSGECLAIFPGNLLSNQTRVVLSDAAPPGVLVKELNMESAEELCGWELLRPSDRPKRS